METMRALTPNRIRRRIRALTMPEGERDATGPIWEGVYERFRDVPSSGSGHESEEWIQGTLQETEAVLAGVGRAVTVPAEVTEERSLLPLLAGVVSGPAGGPVRIVDFGGGAGADYVRVRESLPHAVLEYHVVEIESVCRAGRRLFANDDRIRFHENIPENMARPDIVYLCSALQYVEDYVGLLARLCALEARYILFVKLSAGDIRSFATAQKNVGRSSIPYWFLSVSEVVDLMGGHGYASAFKGALARTYDQSALPPERRLPRMCNLLFVRRDPPSRIQASRQDREKEPGRA